MRRRGAPHDADAITFSIAVAEVLRERDVVRATEHAERIVARTRAFLDAERGPEGLFELIRASAPRLEPRLREVEASQHEVRLAVGRLERYAAARAPMAFLRHGLASLHAEWVKHGALTDDVLQEALLTDLGVVG